MLERLIRKEAPENLGYGTILSVDTANKRSLVRLRSLEVQAFFRPDDFPELRAGDTVALGSTGGQAFIIRVVDGAIPATTTLLEV